MTTQSQKFDRFEVLSVLLTQYLKKRNDLRNSITIETVLTFHREILMGLKCYKEIKSITKVLYDSLYT